VGIELRKLTEHDPALGEALDVMRAAFAGMQGRIDPPSSLGDLTVERLSQRPRFGWQPPKIERLNFGSSWVR
jgi:hypothetical protein